MSRRGSTIIEVMVASAILLLMLGVLYLLMVGGLRYFQQARAYQNVQMESTLGLRKLLAELQDSRASTVVYRQNPTSHVVFLSACLPHPNAGPVVHAPDGHVQWQKWVCYRANGSNLERDELPLGAPTTTPPSPAPVYGAFDFGGADFKVMARNLKTPEDLVLTPLNRSLRVWSGPTADCMRVQLIFSENTSSTQVTELRAQGQVHMYNRF